MSYEGRPTSKDLLSNKEANNNDERYLFRRRDRQAIHIRRMDVGPG
jgi:hypothetical protein